MKRMIAIDGHSLLYRAFYALPGFTTKKGLPTGAVYGFQLMLDKVLADYNPDYVFVAFDSGKPTFRHEQFKDYKAQRPPMPEELRGQVDLTKKLLDLRGIPHISIDGIEADDLIGSAAKLAKDWGVEYLILTGDRDSLQLVDTNCLVLLTKKGISEIRLYDRQAVKDDFAILPEQVPDYKGLVGDPSDNIPGVKGIGAKTAVKLIDEFNNLETILKNIDKLPAGTVKKLNGQEEIALLSKDLATIHTDIDLDLSLESTKLEEPCLEPLREFYKEMEFTTFLKRLPEEKKKTITIRTPKIEKIDDNMLQKEPQLFIEDMGDSYLIAASSWCTSVPKKVQTLFAEDTFTLDQVPKGTEVFTHGAKELFLIEPDLNIIDDLELAGYLLDPDYSHDFKALGERYLDLSQGDSLEERATLAWELRDVLRKELQDDSLYSLYKDIELPLSRVLATMERAGVKVDKEELAKLSQDFNSRMNELEVKIFGLAGEKFNVNSSKQLGEILFDKLGLPAGKKTKTGYSTSAEVLEKLALIHPLPSFVMEYRQLQKLKSTYTDALPELINPVTGRIHTSFNQLITATGRLSSSNPNLQNIPVRTEEGAKIRRCFIPEPGYVLLSADYSQIELRVLAHIAKDPDLIETFVNGEDIHTRTAAEVLGIPIESVTKEQRSSAKAVNFGIIYGISSFGLAKNTDLSKKEAERYITKYLARYPKVQEYMDNIVKEAREKGYVTTLLGRRRYLPEINSSNFIRRNLSERMALNTPIQGTAADIIKIAMLNIDKLIRKNNINAEMLLQVHDELVFEVRKDLVDDLKTKVKKIMEGGFSLLVTIEVDMNLGENWFDLN